MSDGSIRIARTGGQSIGGGSATLLSVTAGAYLALLYLKPVFLFIPNARVVFEYGNVATLSAAVVAAAFTTRGVLVPPQRRQLMFLGIALTAVWAAALFSNAEASATFDASYTIISTWLAYATFFVVGTRERALRLLLWLLLALAALNSVVGLWGAFTGETLFGIAPEDIGQATFGYDQRTGRSGGIVGENYVGMYDLPAVIIGIGLIATPGTGRIVGVVAVAVASAGIAVSYSRTSVASAIASVFVFAVMSPRRVRLKPVLLIGVVLGMAAGITWWAIVSGLSAVRPGALTDLQARWSVSGFAQDSRMLQWTYYLARWSDSLWFGHGPGFIQSHAEGGLLVPHNAFIDVGVEFGIFGLLVYVSGFAVLVRVGARRLDAPEAEQLRRILLACAVGMAWSLLTLSNPSARLLWAMAGALSGWTYRGMRLRTLARRDGCNL